MLKTLYKIDDLQSHMAFQTWVYFHLNQFIDLVAMTNIKTQFLTFALGG